MTIKIPPPRQLFLLLIILMIISCAIVSAAYWLGATDKVDNRWTMDQLTNPDNADLQRRINNALFDNTMVDVPGIGADIDSTVDTSAMDAKLAGLTKNVTTEKYPSAEQLEVFYQQHRADYREASKLWIKVVSFITANHGGQVFEKAQKALQSALKSTAQSTAQQTGNDPSGDTIDHYQGIVSLQLDAKYSRGFTEKLLLLSEQSPELPCWTGPISSSSGAHLVCVEKVLWGAYTPLEEIKSQLINDWRFSITAEK